MVGTPPTDAEWLALFDAAAEFYDHKPWTWMTDDQLFGVLDPETGIAGYCCVLGALGEFLALNVYLGDAGYAGYCAMASSGDDMAAIEDAHGNLDALMAGFSDRDGLTPEERAMIRRLGLTFRGKQRWPSFRYFRPGRRSPALTAGQARHLARALHESVVVAEAYHDHPDDLVRRDGRLLLRRPGRNSAAPWVSVWVSPPRVIYLSEGSTPSEAMVRSTRTLPQTNAVWEADMCYLPMVDGAEPGVIPRLFLLMDHASGLILQVQLENDSSFVSAIWRDLMTKMRDLGGRPAAIWVRQAQVGANLLPLTEPLSIQLKVFRRLPAIAGVRRLLIQHFAHR